MYTEGLAIDIGLIDGDPDQPRKVFEKSELEALAASMAASGQAVAILVRPVGGRYVIVHGERRWRAAQSLGWPTIRAEVRDIPSTEVPWLALVENVQRADLSPVEEAQALNRLVLSGHTQTEIARRVGKTQSYVAQKLRLLKLPASLQLWLDIGALDEGHARQLLRLHGADATAERVAEEAVKDGWSVKRVKLEVDFEEMTWLGYQLLAIDDRWVFRDLVMLADAFASKGWAQDSRRYERVINRVDMIRRYCRLIVADGGNALADAMLSDMPLHGVYWFTKACAEWERGQETVSLMSYLRWCMVCQAVPDVAKQHLQEVIDRLPDDGWEEAFERAFPVMIEKVSSNYPRLIGLSQLETMSRDILVA